jgi:hypothetical protein
MTFKGMEGFIRAHQTSTSAKETAAKLGISVDKYRRRFAVYNHRLRKSGYEPLVRHDKKITKAKLALEQLEKEGLLIKAEVN